MMMRALRHGDRFTCPHCGYVMDATSRSQGRGDEVPATGDVSVCLACGHVHEFVRFGDTVTLRVMPPDKLAEVLADPEVVRVLETWRTARAARLLDGKGWAEP